MPFILIHSNYFSFIFTQLEKERYLDFREKVFGDRTNVFQSNTVVEQRSREYYYLSIITVAFILFYER